METRKAEKERIMSQYTCFVISPIGKEGTELYQRYKDLLELIIIPALERSDGLEVIRGDHCIREARIDTSVIEKVQNADLCICDITEPNPNVFYELGRRDETGKPILLLKQAESGELPVDIATRRYVKYNWKRRSRSARLWSRCWKKAFRRKRRTPETRNWRKRWTACFPS